MKFFEKIGLVQKRVDRPVAVRNDLVLREFFPDQSIDDSPVLGEFINETNACFIVY